MAKYDWNNFKSPYFCEKSEPEILIVLENTDIKLHNVVSLDEESGTAVIIWPTIEGKLHRPIWAKHVVAKRPTSYSDEPEYEVRFDRPIKVMHVPQDAIIVK